MSGSSTFIIAEAGVNHNGALDLAEQLIDVAVAAGADAIKFQTLNAERLVSRNAPKADYQKVTTSVEESQFDMIRKLELDEKAHRFLSQKCQESGIIFLSTPFDVIGLHFLASDLGLQTIKLPSGEAINSPFLLEAARTGKSLILSTGMCTLSDIETALSVMAFGYTQPGAKPTPTNFAEAYISAEGQAALKKHVSLLHCTTEYPTPYEDVNLSAIDTMSAAFGLPVGFSDHTQGIAVSIAAVARGARIIEKHFTLDRTMPGPDHKASLEPAELTQLIQSIRQIEAAIGNGRKAPVPSEMKNLPIARKSLVAAKAIRQGELFTEENLTTKRPGTGIPPHNYWNWLGQPAQRDFAADEVIE